VTTDLGNRPPEPADPVEGAPTPAALAEHLGALRDEMRRRHVESAEVFAGVSPSHRRSAQNLVDYLTLRGHDIRALQDELADLGLSSLGRAEEHVITSVERVLDVLEVMTGSGDGHRTEAAVGFGEGRRELEANTVALLGPSPSHRITRIMVTMPTEAADEDGLVHDLLVSGMDCARVNCAHDGPVEWERMIGHIREAAADVGRPCPVLMDLPGPKLRTGPIATGPQVLRLRPHRDERGVPTSPASAVLVAEAAPPPAGEAARAPVGEAVLAPAGEAARAPAGLPAIPVPRPWLAGLRQGDEVALRDTRGSPRVLEVVATGEEAAEVAVWDTTYIETGTCLTGHQGTAAVGALPPVELSWHVRPGDLVMLTADLTPSSPTGLAGPDGTRRFTVGCTLPEALDTVRPGHRVWFDDGKIGGVVRGVRDGEADVAIDFAAPEGTSLKAGRGINLPDSELDLPAFVPDDDALLRFVAGHADLVGLSFAQRVADVVELQARLISLGHPELGIVLKIETANGFHRLPELLLAAMAWDRLGVMVARGDLAVECGFERLAEIQEEILWICDAAHVPVIWATQVLDQMARTGHPSRAEVSDAAMAGRAECVMLNKGPHIVEAVEALDDILRRMEEHQHKKAAKLRRLRSWAHDDPPGAAM
jgi:pyruvate kinase